MRIRPNTQTWYNFMNRDHKGVEAMKRCKKCSTGMEFLYTIDSTDFYLCQECGTEHSYTTRLEMVSREQLDLELHENRD